EVCANTPIGIIIAIKANNKVCRVFFIVKLFKASSINYVKINSCPTGSVPVAFGPILLSCLYLFSYVARYTPS
ncbi:MAG: hypothetical protein IKW29_00465, partial [Bacteroidaceae bacterium]|nr:hypothetical protein [Bacteroidaceae bacterium]